MFGPKVANATGTFGELWVATVILYELAPGTLVHLIITLFDVAENMEAWIPDEICEFRVNRINHKYNYTTLAFFVFILIVQHLKHYIYGERNRVPDVTATCKAD